MPTQYTTRRSFVGAVGGGILIGGGAAAGAPSDADSRFEAHLSPVAGTGTNAHGKALFELAPDGNALEYRLVVANVEGVTEAHVHRHLLGIPENPPPPTLVAWLYPEDGPPGEHVPGRFSGVLAEGVITDGDVIDVLGDVLSVEDLVEVIRDGDAFVRVDTEPFPDGAIAGDIR